MIRTGYSFRTAIGKLFEVIERLQATRYVAAPICDRNSTFGFNRWTRQCQKAGIRPVYGVELAVVPQLGERKPNIDWWSFLAIDTLRPLHDLILLATRQGGNQLTYQQALSAPGVIRISGNRTLLSNIEDGADVLISLRPSTPKGLYKEAQRRGFRFIACSDNYYANAADRELYRVALGIHADSQSYPQHILSADEWHDAVSWFVNNTAAPLEVARETLLRCQATLKKATLLKPKVDKTLRELCVEGAARTGTDLTNPVYRDRLEKELKLIDEKQFADYFYIIADLVNFAKQKMIVGPARGSSCGSLVCYLLNITSIDPIPFGLIFERFIDINRNDLPDIDIDFSDARREQVFKYAEEKYGKDHVARLGTVHLFRPRSLLNQAGAALSIPKWMLDKVADTIIERSGGDARAMQALEDTLTATDAGKFLTNKHPEISIISRMEGEPNNSSQHAAGIVLTDSPIIDYVAINKSKAAMCDKKDAEDLNLLKIDALGLTQLSIFERTLELIGKPSKAGFLESLPLDDQAAFDVLNRGYFSGVFQFNGMVLQSVTKQLAASNRPVSHFNDIVQITAVCRPGPAASGGTLSWVRRRIGLEQVTTAHPILTELTRETFGIPLFQEQTMQVVRKIGQLSWEDTSSIRKAMSGRLGDEYFARFKEKFVAGALANGLDEATATTIWESIATMGSWQMNKSHCVAYGVVSYWCCWLKAHHPMEFAAATLDAEVEPSRQIAMLRELRQEGIDYIAVDPERSTDHWMPHGNRLIGPLTSIKGIGPAKLNEILDCRKSGEQPSPGIIKLLENARTEIDSLFPIADAIKRHWPDVTEKIVSRTKLAKCDDVVVPNCITREQIVVMGLAERIDTFDENEAIRVQRRGGKKITDGKTAGLKLFLMDDTGRLLCWFDRFIYPTIGRKVVEHGRPGKALWAVKGYVAANFRMLMVQDVKHIGDIDDGARLSIREQGGVHHKLDAGEQQPDA